MAHLQLQLVLRTATVHHAAHFTDKMATVCRWSASSYAGPIPASRRERPATNCSTIVDITRRNDFASGSDHCRPASSSVSLDEEGGGEPGEAGMELSSAPD